MLAILKGEYSAAGRKPDWGGSLRFAGRPRRPSPHVSCGRDFRLLLRLRDREGYCIDRGGVVTEFDVEHLSFWRRDGEGVFHETFGNRDGVCEVGIGADGVEEEELVATERALLFCARDAMNRPEHRDSDQAHQR